MIKKILLLFFLVTIWPGLVLAEGEAQKGLAPSVYLFHLYYDQGRLVPDRDFQFKYDILVEEFASEDVNQAKAIYRGEIVDVRGRVKTSFRFDPQRGDPKFVKGKISVKGPYFADAQEANFYDQAGQKLSTITVSESSFCNDNGVCDKDVGESEQNCPADCQTATPSPSPSSSTTPLPSPAVFNWLIILGALAVLIVVTAVVWLIIKRRKKKTDNMTLDDIPPPQI